MVEELRAQRQRQKRYSHGAGAFSRRVIQLQDKIRAMDAKRAAVRCAEEGTTRTRVS